MRSAIINADDFGLSPGVNRGILEGFRDGVLTSATMLANLPSFDDAAALAAEHELPVGVHLSLLWGPPVADPKRIPSLVDRDGRFFRSAGRLARRWIRGGLRVEEIEIEFDHQVRRVVEAGLRPTHLDTHKHIHALPVVRRALIAVARRFGITRARCPRERGGHPGPGRPAAVARVKSRLIGTLCRDARADFESAGIRTTDHFVGIAASARLDGDTLLAILENLDEGVTEIMCHPGYVDDEMRRYSSIPPHREIELAALQDTRVRVVVESGAVRLARYEDL